MKVRLTEGAVQALMDWIDDGDGGISELTLHVGPGHSGEGFYVSLTEYPEEGAEFLGAADSGAQADERTTFTRVRPQRLR